MRIKGERDFHRLKGSKRTTTPRYCLFVDTESFVQEDEFGTNQYFRLGTAIFKDRRTTDTECRYVFRSLDEFYDIIDKHSQYKSGKLYVIAHNQKYDFVQLKCTEMLHKLGYEPLKVPLIAPRFISASYGKEGRMSITFLDSVNFFRKPLSELGKAIGKDKLEHDEDFNKIGDDDLIEYCMRDTEILRDIMVFYLDFIDEHDLGLFRPTLSGQSFSAFTHRFMSDDIIVPNIPSVINMARMSNRGARTDCLRVGKVEPEGGIYQLDFNSEYPYVMETKRYPVRYLADVYGGFDSNESFLKDTENGFLSIATVKIETNEPVFPYTVKDKVVYPVGTFTTTLTQPELEYAVSHDMVREWIDRHIYEGGYIFSRYIQFFRELKEQYAKQRDLGVPKSKEYYLADFYVSLAKSFMVSLYGKFSQRNRVWTDIGKTEDVGCIEEVDADTGEQRTIMSLGGHSYTVEKSKSETYNSMSEISAFVTAYGRMLIWSVISKVDAYYTDTDSVYTTKEGYDALKEMGMIDPWKFGKLKIEQRLRTITINTVKDLVKTGVEIPIYDTQGNVIDWKKSDDVVTLKGVPKNAKVLKDGRLVGEKFSSIKDGLFKGHTTTKYVVYDVSHEYDKGHIAEDGTVIPFRLTDGVLEEKI